MPGTTTRLPVAASSRRSYSPAGTTQVASAAIATAPRSSTNGGGNRSRTPYFSNTMLSTITIPCAGIVHWSQNAVTLTDVNSLRMALGSTRSSVTHAGWLNALRGMRWC